MGVSGTPPIMGFPHTIPIRIPKDMGSLLCVPLYHKGGPKKFGESLKSPVAVTVKRCWKRRRAGTHHCRFQLCRCGHAHGTVAGANLGSTIVSVSVSW